MTTASGRRPTGQEQAPSSGLDPEQGQTTAERHPVAELVVPPDNDLGVDPIRLGVLLVRLPADHPLVVAARLAIELRDEWRARRQAAADIAACPWRDRPVRVSHAELRQRRSEPGPLAVEGRATP